MNLDILKIKVTFFSPTRRTDLTLLGLHETSIKNIIIFLVNYMNS